MTEIILVAVMMTEIILVAVISFAGGCMLDYSGATKDVTASLSARETYWHNRALHYEGLWGQCMEAGILDSASNNIILCSKLPLHAKEKGKVRAASKQS